MSKLARIDQRDRLTIPSTLFVSASGLLAAATGLWIARLAPAVSYSVSWIGDLPAAYWVVNAAAVACFGFLLARGRLGFAVVVGAVAVAGIGELPWIQGYAAYGRGDPLTYFGNLLVIVHTGNTSQFDFYPSLPLLTGFTSIVTGIDPRSAVWFWSICQYATWILLSMTLAASMTSDRAAVLIAGCVALIPILSLYHFAYYPNGYGLLLLILTLIAWNRREALAWRAVFILLLVALPFSHPLVATLSIALLLGLQVLMVFTRRRGWIRHGAGVAPGAGPAISVIMLASWMLSFPQTRQLIRSAAFGQGRAIRAEATDVTASLFDAVPHMLELARAVAILIGSSAIIALIAAASFRSYQRSTNLKERDLQLLFGAGLLTVAVGVLFFAPTLGESVTFLRLLNLPYPLLLAPVAIAVWLPPGRSHGIFVVLLVAALILSCVRIYPDPVSLQPNDQVTAGEIEGGRWLYDYASNNTLVSRVQSEPYRFVDASEGTEARGSHGITFLATKFVKGGVVPDHFGLPAPLATTLGHHGLLMVTQYDRTIYTTVWVGTHRFLEDDFSRLDLLTSNSVLYSSGDLIVYSF